ncbi:MAG TPA: LytTR family DNA-binding domain-containing protein [Bacteroidales bacterium]|nr:LytTR family DNA-binding domain-containing protein [Bacteroidales bacterium]
MKLLIVENEVPAADRLVLLLRKIDRSVMVTDVLETVQDTVTLLQNGPQPDLILMDIQLDDGLCFEIFETVQVDTPVIFTTAFDEYTLKAFKVNSIDYLLKPVDESALRAALKKYSKIFADKSPFRTDFRQLVNEFHEQYKGRFLVKIGDKYRSLQLKDISCFHITEKNAFIRDINGRDYGVDYSLDHLEGILDPARFYRINRECIVNIDFISHMTSYSSSRLQLSLKDQGQNDLFVVSRERVSDFKKWLDR